MNKNIAKRYQYVISTLGYVKYIIGGSNTFYTEIPGFYAHIQVEVLKTGLLNEIFRWFEIKQISRIGEVYVTGGWEHL